MLSVVRIIPTIPTTRVVLLPDPTPVLVKNSVTGKDLHNIVIDPPSPSYENQRIVNQPASPVVGIVERPFDPPPVLGILLLPLLVLHPVMPLCQSLFFISPLRLILLTPEFRLNVHGHTARYHTQCPVRHCPIRRRHPR